jgi:hypothetical protein
VRGAGPDADTDEVARTILLDQLTGRARSRQELADKLAGRNVPTEVATRLLDRFEEVGLVDDTAFARSWVEGRVASKGLAPRALAQELRRKGVADEVAREALSRIDEGEQEAAARALVGSTTPPGRGAWWGCSRARATVPGWPTASSARSSGPRTSRGGRGPTRTDRLA